jgi:hypothetical protein
MKLTKLLPLTLLAACAAGPGTLDDADGGETGDGDSDTTGFPDAGLPATCDDAPVLELGRCRQAGTDLDCVGNADEEHEFVPLVEGDEMRLVLGPQGSQMLLFLARGSGFAPGDPEQVGSTDNPLVEMWLHDTQTMEEIARYRGYVAFAPEPPDGLLVSSGGLFAVTEHNAAQLAEHPIAVEAILRDENGELRCAEIEISVGS